jgi:competence protein ComEA
MGFKNILRDYFTFNRRERNGVFVLLSIILILIFYLSFSDHFFLTEQTDFSKFDKDIARFEEQLNRNNDSIASVERNNFTKANLSETESKEIFPFDPNNLPEADWKRMGLSDKQIHVIKNYETKGGTFRSNEDLKKMYCITPTLYASLESYIRIPENNKKSLPITNHQPLTITHQPLLVELNSADTLQLDKLKGIGFAFAKRIIKYRELLGGFVAKEQLLEVYGLDKEKYDALSASVFVDDSKIRKIDINAAVFEEMKKHPYLKYNLVNLILNYRKQHGNYKSVTDIKQLDLMSDELFTKIAPYLTAK